MSAVISGLPVAAESPLPLIAGSLQRPIAWCGGVAISAAQFLAHVQQVLAEIPVGSAAVNLCEDRYAFLVSFCAVALAGQTNLLPSSRAHRCVAEVLQAHPGSYAISDQHCDPAPERLWRLPMLDVAPMPSTRIPTLAAGQVVAIGYTSGSTGHPSANPKTWGSVVRSSGLNAQLLAASGVTGGRNVIATVPPQHMYGLETTVLLPLLSDVAIVNGKPLLPCDVALALASVPAPRVLVSTPVHLRALLQSGVDLPPLDSIFSATAALSRDLAQSVEARFGAQLLEMFGSTETCVIASRRTARDEVWTAYPGLALRPQPDGTLADAAWFAAPVVLQDLLEVLPDQQFRWCGRNADLLEIAGKRASLADLNRRLQGVAGVQDAVIFQTGADAAGVQRVAALVVAPGLTATQVLDSLRASFDPAFLPRPLRLVDALPRNETGKLPRAALLEALRVG